MENVICISGEAIYHPLLYVIVELDRTYRLWSWHCNIRKVNTRGGVNEGAHEGYKSWVRWLLLHVISSTAGSRSLSCSARWTLWGGHRLPCRASDAGSGWGKSLWWTWSGVVGRDGVRVGVSGGRGQPYDDEQFKASGWRKPSGVQTLRRGPQKPLTPNSSSVLRWTAFTAEHRTEVSVNLSMNCLSIHLLINLITVLKSIVEW